MDYTRRAALLCCTCYLVLLGVSFIPPQEICGMELRRANVLSDLCAFDSDELLHLEQVELVFDDSEYEIDLEMVEKEIVALELSEPEVERSFSWPLDEEIYRDTTASSNLPIPAGAVRLLPEVEITPIEDYDTLELSAMNRLYRKLLSPDSLVRIAFMGDSFVEADILTADLREALQSHYGGSGVGFAPMHSPLTHYRSTIKTSSKGWSSHNVMQHKKTPQPYASLFSISGWVSLPSASASVEWTTTSVREHIEECEAVRLHFVALNNCSIELSINGEQSRTFPIEGGEELRQIELHHHAIESVTMRITSGHEGFVGYGAIFEGRQGVVVDNYSVRSNNGQAMFWTAPAINAQIDRAVGGYDLVVLQYGLNIMSSGVNKYTSYSAQIEKMIAYCEHCFPKAAILVLGVSDRSIKSDGTFRPMSEAQGLTEYQRMAARNKGVAFWSTYDAMQQQGSMVKFVSNGWAAKDFTHINLKGGRQIAWALFDAINDSAEQQRKYIINRVEHPSVIDSLNRQKIKDELLSGTKEVSSKEWEQ